MTAAAPSEEERVLGQLGIRVHGADLDPVRAACMRVGRHIHANRLRVVGFVPIDDRVAVPPLLIHLGLALCDLSGATVAVVDANVRFPGLSGLARGIDADAHDSVFSTRWLRGALALLTPAKVERAGEVMPQLMRAINADRDLFAHVLVDLTGFELIGEHAAAASFVDAVVLVGANHRSTEARVRAMAEAVPPERFLGVVLVG